ncbi:MAG: hypothetical protein R2939_01415 [Kofleriaceae bacterium]
MNHLTSLSLVAALVLAVPACKKKEAEPGSAGSGSAAAMVGSGSAAKADQPATGSGSAGSAAAMMTGSGSGGTVGEPATGSGSAGALGSAAAMMTGSGSLAMPPAAAKVGDRRVKVDRMETKFTVDAGGSKMPIETVEASTETAEVLAVDAAGLVTKVKIAYSGMLGTQAAGGQLQTKPQPLEGKTYVVWRDGDEIKATTEAGGEVSAEELAALRDDHGDLGKPQAMELIIGGRTWNVGEPFELDAKMLAEFNELKGGPGKPSATAMTLTLTRFDDAVAEFQMVSSLRQATGPVDLTINFGGPVKVDRVHTRPLELVMSGTLNGTAQGAPAAGTIEGKTTYTY